MSRTVDSKGSTKISESYVRNTMSMKTLWNISSRRKNTTSWTRFRKAFRGCYWTATGSVPSQRRSIAGKSSTIKENTWKVALLTFIWTLTIRIFHITGISGRIWGSIPFMGPKWPQGRVWATRLRLMSREFSHRKSIIACSTRIFRRMKPFSCTEWIAW